MRRTIVVVAATLAACQPPPLPDVDVRIGDAAPIHMRPTGSSSLLFVGTLDDAFGCRIQDGFVALRSVQRARDSVFAPPSLTVLLLTRSAKDTLAFSRALQHERLTAHIQTMTPREARSVFDLRRIPAIYLVENGRVVQKWESNNRIPTVMGRHDITDALTQLRSRSSLKS